MTAAKTIKVSGELLARVLEPYKPLCRYLLEASVTVPAEGEAEHLVIAHGRFSIPESCYIDDTGHFNAVEFNLCYNQLVYTLMAQCVADGLLPVFESWTLDEYLSRQLPDVLIHDFVSKFRKPMSARHFEGSVAIKAAADRRKFLLVKSDVSFWDETGSADGQVSLAIVNREVWDPPTRVTAGVPSPRT